MVFSSSNTTKVTLINLNTRLECEGMKSRVNLKKFKNWLKFRFTKIALEFNPYILGRHTGSTFIRVFLKPSLIVIT